MAEQTWSILKDWAHAISYHNRPKWRNLSPNRLNQFEKIGCFLFRIAVGETESSPDNH
jgi:hypothetical protein